MRALVLTAFFALQLSVFACGYDIHVHLPGTEPVQAVQQHNADYGMDADHACHVHTSHTCIELDTKIAYKMPSFAVAAHFTLSAPTLKKIPFSIEYPPKAFV